MLILLDRKIPSPAKAKLDAQILDLTGHSVILELETSGLVNSAISGHPDVFFCKTPGVLVVSPNLPLTVFRTLIRMNIPFLRGTSEAGVPVPSLGPLGLQKKKVHDPSCEYYNVATDGHQLVHRLESTDPVILQNCHFLKKIPVKQGFTRSNLALLKEDHFLTSDPGIFRVLKGHGMTGLFVSPEGIRLPGFMNGFIGGTLGILDNNIFITGNLSTHPSGQEAREFLEMLGYRVIELYEGPLVDGGGLLFL